MQQPVVRLPVSMSADYLFTLPRNLAERRWAYPLTEARSFVTAYEPRPAQSQIQQAANAYERHRDTPDTLEEQRLGARMRR